MTAARRAVVMVAVGEVFAGVERQILALLTHLRADDCVPTLAVFHDRELARRAQEAGLDVVVLPGAGALNQEAVRRIAELVRTTGAPVVHFHGYKSALHSALARQQIRFKAVATIHGGPEYAGPLLGRLRAWTYARCERLAIRLTRARVVFVTRELVQRLPGLARISRYEVIPNGVDPGTVAHLTRPSELDPAHFNVVIVGRLETVKGITFAIEAMRDPRIPATLRLWIVGEGPERQNLERQVTTAGLRPADGLQPADSLQPTDSLQGRVHFAGFRKDAVAFIAHADLLLMPSLHEGLPYTMLEALAAATPIAGSRVGGLAETLEEGRTGYFFPVGDSTAIAATLSSVAADPAAAKQIGQQAHRELFPRFNAAHMARGYEQVYAELSSAN